MGYPSLREEKRLWKKGFKRVVCLDEAGRGPLAGPVTAAAVTICPAKFKIQNSKFKILREIKDSKKLTKKRREEFYKILTKHPEIKWGVGIVSEKTIDGVNIKNATELAMVRALNSLKTRPDYLIIDGSHVKNLKLKIKNLKLIVRADEKVFSCATASIIAKVTRDRIMVRYHKKYPRYGFNKHKGYPTRHHIKMLKKYGHCKIHRQSFAPVKALDFKK